MSGILAVDLGAILGWAHSEVISTESGFVPLRGKSHGLKLQAFVASLMLLHDKFRPECYAVEAVCHHTSVQSAHAYGAYLWRLEEWIQDVDSQIRLLMINVASVKKVARDWMRSNRPGMLDKKRLQGMGKVEMRIASEQRWGQVFSDDNEADARWILSAAFAMLSSTEMK
jgi:hypothetical protein